jgi:uncharacterized membrane protein YhaH (DUF805 family)
MSGANVTNLIIGVAVVALLVSRQLMARRLNDSYRLSVILAVIGTVEFVGFLKSVHGPHDDDRIVVAVVGSLLLAGVLGAARALTVRVWRQDDGQLMRRGTWLTAVLWIVSLAAHLGYDELVAGHIAGDNGANVGDATIVLYLMVTLAVQQFLLLARVKRQEATGEVPTSY